MKKKLYTIACFGLPLFTAGSVMGQTSYLITSNKNWSAVLPSTCANCSIVISPGMTLTIDQSVTCQNCTFEGGNLSMTDKTLDLQYAGSIVTTQFKNIAFQIHGDNGKVIANAPLSLDGATFTFNEGSYFNTSYSLDMVGSKVNLEDNATMYSTGGASTLIRLSSSSKIVIGDGSVASAAAFTVSGPSLDLYGVSSVMVGNTNNSYNNWSDYSASPANSVNAATPKSYSTSNSTMNCGGAGQHACASPALYGPATLATGGTRPSNTLPVILSGFSARSNGDGTAGLTWETEMEQNSSRFEIERSAEGISWIGIGTVYAKGNSSLVSSYSYTDMSLLSGTNYYRLKMVDLDGSAVYSEVKVVQGSVVSHISFFPNPAKEYVNVTLGGASTGIVTVRLVSQAGAVLQEKSVTGAAGTVVTMPLHQVASGLYVLYVSSKDGMHESSKLLINRN